MRNIYVFLPLTVLLTTGAFYNKRSKLQGGVWLKTEISFKVLQFIMRCFGWGEWIALKAIPVRQPLKVKGSTCHGSLQAQSPASQEQLPLAPFFRESHFPEVVLMMSFFFSIIRVFLAVSLPFWCYSIFRHSWDEAPNSQCLCLGTKEAVSLATTTPERSQNSISTCLRFLFNLGVCTSALHGELGSVPGFYS